MDLTYLPLVLSSCATLLDFIYISRSYVLPNNVIYTILVVFICLFVFFLICYRFQISHSLTYVLHFWFGYSTAMLISCYQYATLPIRSILPITSVVLLILAFLSGSMTLVKSINPEFIQPSRWLTDLTMWFGFTFGALVLQNVYDLIPVNAIVLAYWITKHQKSHLCLLAFFAQVGFIVFHYLPMRFQSSTIPVITLDRESSHPLYYGAIYIPVLLSYIIYLMRFNSLNDFLCTPALWVRWKQFIKAPQLLRIVASMLIFSIQLSFLVQCARCLSYSIKVFIQLPFFLLTCLLWLVTHLLMHLTLYKLNSKISVTNAIHQSSSCDEKTALPRIWAANGFRHLAIMTQPIFLLSLVFTTAAIICVYYPHGDDGLVLFQLCLPIELCLYSVVREMGRTLGGSCAGFAMVMPPLVNDTSLGAGENPSIQLNRSPSSFIRKCLARVDSMRAFFSAFSIYNHGCGYFTGDESIGSVLPSCSSGGTSKDNRGSTHIPIGSLDQSSRYVSARSRLLYRIGMFFRQRVPDTGVRFDTYLLYHSGATNIFGDWILNDGSFVDLESLLDIWNVVLEECQTNSSECRLLLVIDSLNTTKWYKKLLEMQTPSAIALQTVFISNNMPAPKGVIRSILHLNWLSNRTKAHSTQLSLMRRVGEFTNFWIHQNYPSSDSTHSQTRNHSPPLLPMLTEDPPLTSTYVTTSSWMQHTTSRPSYAEVENYWRSNFPFNTWHLLSLVNRCSWNCNFRLPKCPSLPGWLSRWRPYSLLAASIRRTCRLIWITYRRLVYSYSTPTELDTGHGFRLLKTEF